MIIVKRKKKNPNAEETDRQCGKIKHLQSAYLLSNISAKKYQNCFIHVSVIANQRWDVYLEQC